MAVIHKYHLTEKVEMPDQKHAEILSVQVQYGKVVMWAKVEPMDAPVVSRQFYIIPTGGRIPEEANHYLGTFQLNEGRLVYHVFEQKDELVFA
jgi:hypothetical protein